MEIPCRWLISFSNANLYRKTLHNSNNAQLKYEEKKEEKKPKTKSFHSRFYNIFYNSFSNILYIKFSEIFILNIFWDVGEVYYYCFQFRIFFFIQILNIIILFKWFWFWTLEQNKKKIITVTKTSRYSRLVKLCCELWNV
jgi:hypothetical protein